MEIIAQIIETVVFGIVALVALLVVLIIAVSFMPKENPLRQLMAALARPVGVMVGTGVVSLPLDIFPPLEGVYDIAALIFIIFSWLKFFKVARGILPQIFSHAPSAAPSGDPNISAGEYFARAQGALKRKAYPEAMRFFRFAAERGHAAAKKYLEEKGFEQTQQQQREQRARSANGGMSRAEALAVLDLTEGATEDEIGAAHSRLIKQFHPDKGGSTFFAKQLNEARKVLLSQR